MNFTLQLLFLWLTALLGVSAGINEHCFDINSFQAEYEYSLDYNSLVTMFKQSKVVLGNGAFAQVKQIKWRSSSADFVGTVAVKKIIVASQLMQTSVDLELEGLMKARGKTGLIQHIDCMRTEELVDENGMNVRSLKSMNSLQRVRTYVKMAESLQQLHDLDIVHSDVKPANFMVAAYDSASVTSTKMTNFVRIKLADFGFSAPVDSECRGYSKLYSPPEAFIPGMKLEKSFDVFSFGMTIGILETGLRYIVTPKLAAALEKDPTEFIDSKNELILAKLEQSAHFGKRTEPNGLTNFVSKCVARNIQDRIDSRALVQKLRAVEEELVRKYRAEYDKKVQLLAKPGASRKAPASKSKLPSKSAGSAASKGKNESDDNFFVRFLKYIGLWFWK